MHKTGTRKILEATNKTREIVPLCNLKANYEIFVLVIYVPPDGSNKDQVKNMHKKETVWATDIIVGGVQKNKAWKALNSTISQTIKYPLSAMILNKK